MEQHPSQIVIIGAGPAGLAVGACLRRAGRDVTLLERSGQVGAAWHAHYDRLHLHTDKANSALPYLPFPKGYPRYPSRQQVAAYLTAYAEHFELAPHFDQSVTSVKRAGEGWEIQTQRARYRAASVVIATGYTREPVAPSWPGQAGFPGPLLHSAHYRNGEPFRGQRVLVVGFGNSAGEIALDLCEYGAQPTLAVRGAVNVIPREILGIPILAIAVAASTLPARVADALTAPILRVMYGDLARYGLRRAPHGPFTQIQQSARIPLIDIGTMEQIERGAIQVRPGITRFDGETVHFSDGTRAAYEAVVLATGYRPRVQAFLEGVDGLLDGEGTPLRSGVEVAPGLFFCGFYVSPVGMLREIAREARAIARAIQQAR